MRKAKVLWFTGLSGSGKTTIASKLLDVLKEQGCTVKIFDGDDVRAELHCHLGFTPEDIKENNRLISQLCLKHISEFDVILVPIISPFYQSRRDAREKIGNDFIEVYIQASLDEVKRRDVKGLYKKALNGEIDNFIGINSNVPYEVPIGAEIVVDTQNEEVEESVDKIKKYLLNKLSYRYEKNI